MSPEHLEREELMEIPDQKFYKEMIEALPEHLATPIKKEYSEKFFNSNIRSLENLKLSPEAEALYNLTIENPDFTHHFRFPRTRVSEFQNHVKLIDEIMTAGIPIACEVIVYDCQNRTKDTSENLNP